MTGFSGKPLTKDQRFREIERLRRSIEYQLSQNYHFPRLISPAIIAADITILKYLEGTL